MKKKEHPIKVGLISLGCAKNLVDAEIMLGSLIQSGLEITNNPEEADAVIVNTCSFIDAAQEESVDAILQSADVREACNREQSLIVSGCLPQRFRDELPKLLPEVDAFMGIDQVSSAAEIVHKALEHRRNRLAAGPAAPRRRGKTALMSKLTAQKDSAHDHAPSGPVPSLDPSLPLTDVNARPRYIPDFQTPRFRLTPSHFAYVKIAEGCNHPCSFCIIPRMRGTHRSRLQHDIADEARELIAQGVKELNLISQDSTYYGLDLRPQRSGSIASPEKFKAAAKALPESATTLCTLIPALNDLPGEFWIRLLYTHPAHWTEKLIETIAACSKVTRYIDIPLQHIHPVMLERMRRETSMEYIVELLQKIRKGIPGIALRTTFIVGFPGETEAYFQTLLDFIRETRFERLGVFAYSQESGTRAGSMAQQVPEKVRLERRDRAMAAQLKVAREISGAYVGRTIRVLLEKQASARELQGANISSWEHGFLREQSDKGPARLRGGYHLARGEADAPDIDGRVYVAKYKGPLGQFATVKVVGHTDYDLIAEPAS